MMKGLPNSPDTQNSEDVMPAPKFGPAISPGTGRASIRQRQREYLLPNHMP